MAQSLLRFRYFSTMPKISKIAILVMVITALGLSSVEAATSTLSAPSVGVTEGQTVSIPIVLSDAPTGVSGFDITVTLSNGGVARINGATLADYGLVQQESPSSSRIRLRALDLNGLIEAGASGTTLFTLDVSAVKRGGTDINIQVSRLDDDGGNAIDTQIIAGSLSVKKLRGGGKGNGKKK